VNETGHEKVEVVLPRDEAARAFIAVENAARKVGRAADSIEACTQKAATSLGIRELYVKGVADGIIIGSVVWIGIILTWFVLGRLFRRS
jgi:hypothetical protein